MLTNYQKYELITWRYKNKNKIEYNSQYFANDKKFISDEIIDINNFENKYKRIDLSCFDHKIIKRINKLPTILEYLELNNSYNELINLPDNLLVLLFGYSFNKLINYPDNIFFIWYGCNFNCPVDNLPSKLEYLIFGESFNQPLENLPTSLCSLYLSNKFTHSLDYLPENIKFLNLSCSYSKNLDNLPLYLNELIFTSNNNERICNYGFFQDAIELFLLSIKKNLGLFDYWDKINKKNIYSYKNEYFRQDIYNYVRLFTQNTINNLPNNLEYLFLGHNKQIITNFPEKIKYINFGNEYEQELPIDNLVKLQYVELINLKSYKYQSSYNEKFNKTKSKNLKIIFKDKKKTYVNKNRKDLSFFDKINVFCTQQS